MTTAQVYTSFYELNNDLSIYIALRNGETLNLSLFPEIATNRWSWIVENFGELSEDFREFANGEQYLEDQFADLERSVQSFLIGNKSNPLRSPEKIASFREFFQIIPISRLNVSNAEQNLINEEIQRVGQFRISQFRRMLDYLKKESNLTAQFIGLADELSARARGVSVVAVKRQPTFFDLLVLNSGIELEKFVEGIIVELKREQNIPPNLLAIANRNIDSDSSVLVDQSFISYRSVPFSGSLQQMAQRFLGSPDFWFELVTVNNLKAPFVDDIGTKVALLSSGSGNTIYISSAQSESVRVDSKLKIGSFRFKEEPRVVERIVDNRDGTLTLFLSGPKDLSRFTVADKSYARVFKPGTVTTGSFIYIPTPAPSSFINQPPPQSDELARLDPRVLAFGVDIQRDERTNDFIIDASGNFKLSAGAANIRQTVLAILRLEQGDLPYRPLVGLPQQIGDRYFNLLSEAEVISDVIVQAVLRDPRFTNVFGLELLNSGNGFSMSLNASIQDVDTPIPLDFIG